MSLGNTKTCFKTSNNNTCCNYFEKQLIENVYRFPGVLSVPLNRLLHVIIACKKPKTSIIKI